MADLTIEEQLEQYPYLKQMSDCTLFVTQEEYNEMYKSEKIKIGKEAVSIEYLKRILNDPKYFDYAKKYFMGEINVFTISYIIYGDTGGNINYEKVSIIKAIEQLIKDGRLSLSDEELNRFNILKGNVTYEMFVEKNGNKTYELDVDGNNYTFQVRDILELLQMPEEEFNRLCSDNEIKTYKGFPKEHFIYASYVYFKKNEYTNNFLFPPTMLQKLYEIETLQKIDIQAINKHLETKDSMFRKVVINPALEQEILKDMPEDVSSLEKAIYIYIKMCKLLTYDQEYYAVNQKGPATLKHQDINFVSTITPENNEVVCFEFNLIYSKLLDKLGIKFASDYKNMVGEAYGDAHANLEFRCDKYMVSADSVTSILQGDIMQAKLNQPLVGLKCLNVNLETQQEFNLLVKKMYELIVMQEKGLTDEVGHTQTLDELLREYAHLTSNLKEVSLDEKLSILGEKVNSRGMVGIDTLSYVLQLRKVLFTEEERKDNVVVSIVRDNNPEQEGKIAAAKAIMAINKEGFEQAPDNTVYYYLDNNKLVAISKEELQTKFANKDLEYIEKDDPRIPGISEGLGVSK